VFSWENLIQVPQSTAQRGLERLLNSRIDGAIAGSDAASERIKVRGYDGALVVAPQTGVDTEAFSPGKPNPKLLSKFDIPASSTRIGYVGRFAPEKGLNTLLDAVPKIVEHNRETHLFLIGDGEQSEHIINRIRNNQILNEYVSVIAEFQSYNRMPDIIRLADVIVYPSETVKGWTEQFGYSVAEAMACDVPVVTTDCGSLPHVVGATGRIGPQGDSKKLAENITELLSNERLRNRLANAARRRVLSEFSLSAVAESHLDLLADIAD
jgi:glycosyltransferase involved in cell wall biosynthesis